MSVRYDIISIGTLSRNLLWNEGAARRQSHATCILIRGAKRNVIVNPGLPGIVIATRLNERSGLAPSDITDLFFTHLAGESTVGADAFPQANAWASEVEIDDAQRAIEGEEETSPAFRTLLDRIKAAPDKLMPGVDLFPLHGHTPGTSGLLIAAPLQTILITGPAVATQDHFLAQQVLPDARSLQEAKESLVEAFEIADIIVPGYDNHFVNPRQLR